MPLSSLSFSFLFLSFLFSSHLNLNISYSHIYSFTITHAYSQSSIHHSHIDPQTSYILNHSSYNKNHKNTSKNSSRNTTSRICAKSSEEKGRRSRNPSPRRLTVAPPEAPPFHRCRGRNGQSRLAVAGL
jgi:hypothetical protein